MSRTVRVFACRGGFPQATNTRTWHARRARPRVCSVNAIAWLGSVSSRRRRDQVLRVGGVQSLRLLPGGLTVMRWSKLSILPLGRRAYRRSVSANFQSKRWIAFSLQPWRMRFLCMFPVEPRIQHASRIRRRATDVRQPTPYELQSCGLLCRVAFLCIQLACRARNLAKVWQTGRQHYRRALV